jgi:hypothetical protein
MLGAMGGKDIFTLLLAAVAAGAAIASAWIFEGQLTAMQDQLAVMKADQRPWVGLEKFEPSSAPNGQGFEFAAIVKNSGKTAATNVHGSFITGFFGNDVLAAVPKDCGDKCSVGLLLPDGILKWRLAISTSDVQKTIANNEGAFYALGRIDYEDNENKYWTTICWYYDRDLQSLAAWSNCNEVGSLKKQVSRDFTKREGPITSQIEWSNDPAILLSAASVILSAVTLFILALVEIIRPCIRRHKLKRPFDGYFLITSRDRFKLDYVIQDAREHFLKELVVSANSEIPIHQILLQPRLSFSQRELYFGCGEGLVEEGKPRAVEWFVSFITQGVRRSGKPDEAHPGHYTDYNGFYHVKEDYLYTKDDRVIGFKLVTKKAGTYAAQIYTVTDDVRGVTELTIKVENPATTRMRCVRKEHRECFVAPRQRDA